MSNPTPVVCPHCLQAIQWPLPDQPLYSLADAQIALLIPTRGAMWTFLYRHRSLLDKPRYAFDAGNKRHRVLTAAEIQRLREKRRLSVKGVMHWMVGNE